MADKTKAELKAELAALKEVVVKAEKNLAKANAAAGSGHGTALPSSAGAKVNSAPHGGHVCPKTGVALGTDSDVYSTEARLRSERDAWRSFGGGHHGDRGPKPGVHGVKASSSTSSDSSTEARLRAERNDWRAFAGGSSGMRGSSEMLKVRHPGLSDSVVSTLKTLAASLPSNVHVNIN